MRINNYFSTIAVFVLCGTFCFSAINKVLYWTYTIELMEKLVLEKTIALVLSIVIVLIELILAISIYEPRFWKYTGIFSSIILFAFGAIALWGKYEGKIIQCPCFGKFFGSDIGVGLIIRNSLLIIVGLILSRHVNSTITEKRNV